MDTRDAFLCLSSVPLVLRFITNISKGLVLNGVPQYLTAMCDFHKAKILWHQETQTNFTATRQSLINSLNLQKQPIGALLV